MKSPILVASLLVLGLLMPATVAKGQDNGGKAVAKLETFFEINTFGCVHINLEQFQTEAFLKTVELRRNLLSPVFGPGHANGIIDTAEMVAEVADRLKAEGATDVFIPIGMYQLATPSQLVIVVGNADQAFKGMLITKKAGRFTIASDLATLKQFANGSRKPQRSDLATLMNKVEKDNVLTVILKPSADHSRVLRETVADLPDPFGKLNGPLIADAVEYIRLSIRSFEERQVELVIKGKNDEVVREFSKELYEAAISAIGVTGPNGTSIQEITKSLVDVVTVKTKGGRLALTLPANRIDAFEKTIQPGMNEWKKAAAVTMTQNQVRQFAIAFHNSADAHRGSLPAAAITSEDGKALLSWRVHILAYMDDYGLYKQFHLDEPWDSPHNKKLISKMPSSYSVSEGWLPKAKIDALNQEGKTIFVLPRGEGMYGRTERVKFQEIKDGTSNTIMILTAPPEKAVIWTKPDDLMIDANDPGANIFSAETTQTVVSMGDASTRVIQSTIKSKMLKALLSLAGGETD